MVRLWLFETGLTLPHGDGIRKTFLPSMIQAIVFLS